MSYNAECMAAELTRMGIEPRPFVAPQDQGGAEGVQFDYLIEDGSRAGETVTLGIAVHKDEGQWPEIAPHWVYISPPDTVLAELVKGSKSPGVVRHHHCDDGQVWMVISAPPSDFWDTIEKPKSKNMETYLQRHIRRIWSTR